MLKLIKKLIDNNYSVINIDNNLFGNYFIKNKKVKNYKLDINQIQKINVGVSFHYGYGFQVSFGYIY